MSDDFREIGYESAKVRSAVAAAKWAVIIFGAITFYLLYTFIEALDGETLRVLATTFFYILMALFGLAGALVLVVIFRYVQKPGVQLPGKLGEYERRLGLD